MVLALATAACYAGESAVDGDDATTVAAATAVDPTPTTSAGEDTGDDSGEDTGAPAKPFMPGPPVLPRLTQRQYLNSIEALLGPGLPSASRRRPRWRRRCRSGWPGRW